MKKFTLILTFLIAATSFINAQVVTTLAGNTSGGGSNNGTGTVAQFNQPNGVATDGTNLYVVDQGNNIIRKVVIATGVVTRLAGGGGVNSTFQGHANGTGTTATFNQPAGVASDGTNLYVADYNNNLVRQIVISSGAVTTIAGGGSAGAIASGHADGTGTAATFSHPNGLFVYGDTLFIADAGNNEIRSLVLSTGVVSTLAGSTTSGHTDGTGTAATFSSPYSVVADKNHNLYVVDNGNNEIRKIVIATGVVTTFAGTTASGYADGIGTAASFNNPNGLTIDAYGNLYLADLGNQEIRKIVIASAAVTTYAGSTTNGSADGIGTAATFNYPLGVVADASGNLYVTDYGNNEIRALSPPAPVAAFNANHTTVCMGGTVQFTDMSSNTPASWKWTFQNGSPRTSTAQNPLITFYGSGADTVKLVVTNASGSDSITNVAYINVNALPAITIATDVIGGGLACGHSDTLTANVAGNGSFSYNWNTASTTDTIMVGSGISSSYGIVTTLAGSTSNGSTNGVGTAARFNVPNSVVSDGLGNLYVTDLQDDEIRKVVIATGVVTELAGGNYGSADGVGTNAQFQSFGGIAYDGNGNLFVSDNEAIRKIVIATGEVTTFAGSTTGGASVDGIGSAAEFYNPQGLACDGNGNLYVADSRNQEIRMISTLTGMVTTLAGSTASGSNDGIGTAAQFRNPGGVACDGKGNVYVADKNNAEIRKIVVSTGVVTTIAGTGYAGDVDGIGSAASFSGPADLVYDGNGNLYIIDTYNNNVRKLVLSTEMVTTVCGKTQGSANGTGTAAQFYAPTSIAIDNFGNLFVADYYNNQIREIAIPNTYAVTVTDGNGCVNTSYTHAASFSSPVVSINTNVISGSLFCAGTFDTLSANVTGNGPYLYNWNDGANTDTAFVMTAGTYSVTITDFNGCTNSASKTVTTNPAPVLSISSDIVGGGLACGHNDTLTANAIGNGSLAYAWNTAGTNDTIMVGTAAPQGGVVTTLAGSGSGYVNGIGTAAQFYYITGVASDGMGNLYVADQDNRAIRKIVIATGAVTRLAGGKVGSEDGIGTAAQFGSPFGIAYDGNGNLFTTDNNTVREINISTAQVTTIAGSAGSNGSADGVGTAARFGYLQGLTCDGKGNLYVTDQSNAKIRQVVISTGVVTTLAGSTYGSADGVGSSAQFGNSAGIVYDGNGNLYVVDQANDDIRKVNIASATVTTLVGSPGYQGNTDDTGSAARFYTPAGITYDGNGNLYVTDLNNYTVRQISIPTKKVSTLCGSTNGYVDGTGSAAEFGQMQSITIDNKGDLYIGDEDNAGSVIRKVTVPNTYVVAVTDANGCTSTAHTIAASFTSPAITINANVISGVKFCAGMYDTLSSTIIGAGPYAYNWSNGSKSDTTFATIAGTYSLTVTDVNGCTNKANVALTTNSVPVLTISSDIVGGAIACGKADTLTANATGNGSFNYNWNTTGTNDTVMVIDPASTAGGIVTTIAGNGNGGFVNGNGSNAKFYYPTGVASDKLGNLYITEQGNYDVRKIAVSTGAVTTLAGNNTLYGYADATGSNASFEYPYGIVADGNGNVYITDHYANTVRKIETATGVVTTIAGSAGASGSTDGIGSAALFNSPAGIAYDGAGNLYVADMNNNAIRKIVISSGSVTTFAGGNSGETDGVGTTATFYGPNGVAYDGSGNLYVVDEYGGVIRKIVLSSASVFTVAGTPFSYQFSDGVGANAHFYYPTGITYDGVGNVYISDINNYRIRKMSLANYSVTTVAGGTSGSANGTGPNAQFSNPNGLTIDGLGNLFVADVNNQEIREIALPNTYAVTVTDANGCQSSAFTNAYAYPKSATVGITVKNANSGGVVCTGEVDSLIASGTGNSLALTYSWNNGSGADTLVVTSSGTYSVTLKDSLGCIATASETITTNPQPVVSITSNVIGAGSICTGLYDTLTVKATGNGSFGYSWNNMGSNDTAMVLPLINNNSIVSTLAGSINIGSANAVGTAAGFSEPEGITTDGNGNLYVADHDNSIIRKVNIFSGLVTTLAGSAGVIGHADGAGSAASFYYPYGITYDGSGNLFVVDQDNQTIRKIVIATGVVSTFAGAYNVYGNADGIGGAASFNNPAGIACDGNGSLFVADNGNNEIRQIVIATGAVTTLAGSTNSGSNNGVGTAASFYYPSSIACDGSGNVYVGDGDNYEIRKIVVSTGAVSTFIGHAGGYGNTNGVGSNASFGYIGSMTYSNGSLILTDENNYSLRGVNITADSSYTIAGTGNNGFQNGIGTSAQFSTLLGVCTDGNGNIFVSDADNNMVRKVVLPNTYSVVVTDANGCKNSTSINIDAKPSPIVNITGYNTSGATICSGTADTIMANATGSGALTYKWSNAGTQDTTVVSTAGVYTVTVKSSNGCSDTASVRIIAAARPTVSITPDVIGGTVFCSNAYDTLMANVTGVGTIQYNWSNGSNSSSDWVFNPGTFDLTVTDGNGCTNTASITVSTVPSPTVSISDDVIGGSSFCAGSKDTLVGNVTGTGPFSYNWNGAGSHDTLLVTTSGTYTLTVTSGNGCTATRSRKISVKSLPAVIITGTNTIALGTQDTLTAKGTSVSYVWSSGSVSDTTMVTPVNNTTYTVIGTGTNGCSDTATFKVTIAPLGIASVGATDKTTLYPNPTISSVNLTFEMQGTDVAAEVTIMDAIGKEIMTENATISNGKVLTLNVGMLAQGTYFVKVVTNNITRIERFVKQ